MTTPILILSDFRSGSTLLRFILDAHPDICSPAELNLAHFCQDVFRVVELTTDDAPGRVAKMTPHRIELVRRVVDHIMNDYCRRKGKPRWCEKSPANTHLLPILGAVFPDAQFIFLYRHGLDQVRSLLEMDDAHKRVRPFLSRNGGNVVAAAVDRWCCQVERLLAFEKVLKTGSYRIKYEECVGTPAQTLSGLITFLGVSGAEDLCVKAFQSAHDRGPGDLKARRATAIDPHRVGLGRSVEEAALPLQLEGRFIGLLAELGYEPRSRSDSP